MSGKCCESYYDSLARLRSIDCERSFRRATRESLSGDVNLFTMSTDSISRQLCKPTAWNPLTLFAADVKALRGREHKLREKTARKIDKSQCESSTKPQCAR
jgi:hypothetical protein